MDFLASVLRYKFWICFLGAILLPSVGWYLATGAMETEVKKRFDLVNKKFDSNVLKESTVAKMPNEKYIEGMKQINTEMSKDLWIARDNLQKTQQKYMTWPTVVNDAMAGAGYRKPPTDPDALFKYGNVYRQELEQVRQIVHPYNELTKKGIVYAPEGILPKAQDESWAIMGPPVERMWDAQEDIWLLTSIMQAIAAVNKDATSVIDAPIKAINEVALRGGSKVDPAATAANGAPAGAPPSTRVQTVAPANTGGVSFNPADEFGPELSIAPAPKAAEPSAAESEDEDPSAKRRNKRKADRVSSKSETAASAAVMVSRYIAGSNTEPQKTRGFYLQVAMDHTFVPELVAQLSNMPWPTEIVRVQQSDEVSRTTIRGRVESGLSASAASPAASTPSGFGSRNPAGGISLSFSHSDAAESEPEDSGAAKESAKTHIGGPGNNKMNAAGAVEKDLVSAALDDPYVGLVVIAGTMTIYNQPADPPVQAQAAQQQAQPKPAEGQSEDEEQPEAGEAKPPAKAAAPPANPAPNAGTPANQQPKQDNPQSKAPAPPNAGAQPAAATPVKPPDPPAKKADPPTKK